MLPRDRWEARSGSDGYAVFGEVIGGEISVIAAVGAVPVHDESLILGPTFAELPLLNPAREPRNLVMVNSVVPEPGTLALALTAMLLASGFRKYRQTEA